MVPGRSLTPPYNPAPMEPEAAREHAQSAVAALRAANRAALVLDDVDLGMGLEQQLFFAFRDERPLAGLGSLVSRQLAALVRTSVAVPAALVSLRSGTPEHAAAFLVRQPVHLEVIDRIGLALKARGGPPVIAVLTGRAEQDVRPSAPGLVRLKSLLQPRRMAGLAGYQSRLLASATSLRRAVVGELGTQLGARAVEVALSELPRIAMATAAFHSAVDRLKPAVVGAFDEVGTWARILPAVAGSMGIPSLDVPHAEAADAAAIVGAGYDRMAVYGPRSSAVLRAAQIDARRIVEVGAPRFDALVERTGAFGPPASPPRVLFAAQYVAGALSAEGFRLGYEGALAAAERLAPSTLIIRPHPAEPPGAAAALVAGLPRPAQVSVEVEANRSLHDLLDGAWVLVTAWSNSVFEAALAGIPSISVVPGNISDPAQFVAEGLAIGATTPQEAADAADRLRDPVERSTVIDRARAALGPHLGNIDGHASDRIADLVTTMIRGRSHGEP
jgi:hypothetical protein